MAIIDEDNKQDGKNRTIKTPCLLFGSVKLPEKPLAARIARPPLLAAAAGYPWVMPQQANLPYGQRKIFTTNILLKKSINLLKRAHGQLQIGKAALN